MARIFQRKNRQNSPHRDDWVLDFVDAQGKRRFISTRQKNKRVAQELLNDKQTKVIKGEWLGVVDESSISFKNFCKQWLDGLRTDLRLGTRQRWDGIIEKHLKPYFNGSLRAIKPATVEAYVRQRVAEKASASSINHETGVLKMMLRRAAADHLLSRNPLLDGQGRALEAVRPLKEPAGRVRYLSLAEMDAVLKACVTVPCLKAFVVVALNTGMRMRRGEILSLTHKMIDRENNLVRLTETKTGEARVVHLNRVAMAALESLPRRLDGKLFPFGPNQVSVAFLRAARRAKVEDFRLHDLRHTFCSYQAMHGVHQRGLQDLLGHADSRMTQRYTHLNDAFLKAAVDSMSLGGESPGTAIDTAAETATTETAATGVAS